jgi:uncharacterized membrane protein YtjA (UPF0391 family)
MSSILSWIIIFILIGIVFTVIGFPSVSNVAFGGAKFLVGIFVFVVICGLIFFALNK